MKSGKRQAKSEFWKLRHKAGLGDKEKAAELCGVTVRTIENWDRKGATATATRLLHLWDRKECAGAGPEWAGFMFSRGKLVHARLKLHFTPERLKHWPEAMRQLERAEADIGITRNLCPVMRAARRAGQRWKWAAGLAEGLERLALKAKRRSEGQKW